ncbi:MAG TPA: ANTAR domain-containing protein [Rhabdaerophilum sp.]|nr:ANTAR domain-containing protein [Rhabdaerophilum sp.]
MNPDLSILILDENGIRAAIIEAGLRGAGHTHVSIVSDMNGIVRRIAETAPDVIVIDLENPNRDQLEHVLQMSRVVERPIAMFVDRSDTEMMASAIEAGVSAYVVDGLRQDRVKPILDMAIARFNAYSRLRSELEDTRRALEDRKAIDRAKAILIRTRGLSEDEAHHLLRRTAMQQSARMGDVARALVASAELLLGDRTTGDQL